MREALDAALKVSVDGNDLRKALRERGYELDANPAHKYATLRQIGSKKAVRLYRLGEEYDLPALRERIGENRQRYAHDFSYQRYKPMPIQQTRPKRLRLNGAFSAVKKSVGSVGCISTIATVWVFFPKRASTALYPRNCGRNAVTWTQSANRRS